MTLEVKDKMENADVIKFLLEQIKELKEKVDKLENQNRYRDSNNKLSNYAQKAIEASKGPLKPDKLQNFLIDEVLNKHNKKILPIIRKYSNNIDGVKKQILWVYDNIETHMIHRKQQKELDDRLIKKIRKLKESVEEEQGKEKKVHFKIQSTLDHYFDPESNKTTSDENRKQSKVIETSKCGMAVNQSEKGNRKRKSTVNDETSSSQESGVTFLSSEFSIKHSKLNAPENSAESSQSSELMSVEELDDCNSQHTEPMSVESAECSQSSTEPMSVDSTRGSQSSAEPMSIVNSEESSSQSDVLSADDSSETVKKTKSTKKLRGKVSKQQESRLGKDAADHNKNEETVPERNLRIRK